MTRDIIAATPRASVSEVARLLVSNHISGVPVVDESHRLVGLVTEGDLILWAGESGEREAWWLNILAEGADLAPEYLDFLRSQQETVRCVMKTDIITIGEDMPVGDIAALMVSKGINRFPVVTDGRLVGIVARADLVRAMSARSLAPEAPSDHKAIGRESERPLLGSEGIEKQELPARPRGRRSGPLFP